MSESQSEAKAKQWRTPLWAWGIVVLAALVGYWALDAFGGGGGGELPPGFVISTGSDSGGTPADSSPRVGRESLEDLIAATVSGDSVGFQASIAILPLENRTGDTLYDTLGGGMAEELISRLSRIRGLKVTWLQSVRQLEGLDLPLNEIADTLGVDHILRGTAFPYQDAARIQVRLLRVSDEEELWSNDYSLDWTNQMRAVEEISEEVSAKLLEQVPALSPRDLSRSTDSPGYVSYLAGSRLLNTRTRDGLIRAIDAFKTAIDHDSTFALAYAALSSAYALSITYRYDIGLDGYAAAGLALSAASTSVQLDPELAEGYAARGYISSVALAPTQTVLEDFTRALDLQPNAPNVPAWYANLLVREGYHDQALAQAQRAVELDPLSPARRTGLAFEALRARDYGLAIREARTAVSLRPDVVLPRSILAMSLLLSGRAEDCLELDLGPHAGLRAMCLHDMGFYDQAVEIADSLRGILQAGGQVDPEYSNVIPAGDLASYLAWTGSQERAMPWIHRAYALSPSGIDARVLESGIFEGLLADTELRREVAEIRDRIWARVLREVPEGEVELGRRDR